MVHKQFRGVRIRESAATTTLTEAVELLASRIEATRQSQLYGVRPMWSFREAAQKYLKENQQKKSVNDDERHATVKMSPATLVQSFALTAERYTEKYL
jgi:hypothetical protein